MTRNRWLILTLVVLSMSGAAVALTAGGQGGQGEATPALRAAEGAGLRGGWGLLPRGVPRLDLSPAQRDAIRAILARESERIQSLREQLAANREAFRAANPPGKFDEAAVRAHHAKQAKLREELAVVAARVRAEVYALLTAEQKAQLEAKRQRWEECRRGYMGRGLGRGRG